MEIQVARIISREKTTTTQTTLVLSLCFFNFSSPFSKLLDDISLLFYTFFK